MEIANRLPFGEFDACRTLEHPLPLATRAVAGHLDRLTQDGRAFT